MAKKSKLKARSARQPGATPAALGYRMPAEWEPHAATWIAWPHNKSDWPGKFPAIPWVYAEIVRHLARVERVEILVQDKAEQERAAGILERSSVHMAAVRFHRWPTNRVWTRDYAPIFVKAGAAAPGGTAAPPPLAAVNWRFNAWAKYSDWQLDEAASGKIVGRLRVPQWRPEVAVGSRRERVVLEGGSIDVNGSGALLATEECLLSPVQQRNPGLDRSALEQLLAEYLSVRKVLLLGRCIVGDDTHGHVDDIARFVSRDTVVAAVEPDAADANYEPLQDNLRRLRGMTNERGEKLRVVELPMPKPVIFRGQRLPASYANFYLANKLVLVPTFNDLNDRRALNIVSEVFPERQVAGIYCGDLIWGLGALHCMTQQQPE